MSDKSKIVDLLKYYGKNELNNLLNEYNNDINKLYNDALSDVRNRLIDHFFDSEYINSKSFCTLIRIFNNWEAAPQEQLEIRDRNEYEYFNK